MHTSGEGTSSLPNPPQGSHPELRGHPRAGTAPPCPCAAVPAVPAPGRVTCQEQGQPRVSPGERKQRSLPLSAPGEGHPWGGSGAWPGGHPCVTTQQLWWVTRAPGGSVPLGARLPHPHSSDTQPVYAEKQQGPAPPKKVLFQPELCQFSCLTQQRVKLCWCTG